MLFKFVLTVLAAVVFMLHTQTIGYLAGVAADDTVSSADLRTLGASPVLHAAVAMVMLLLITDLAVYKPPGMTPYGRRTLYEQRAGGNTRRAGRSRSNL